MKPEKSRVSSALRHRVTLQPYSFPMARIRKKQIHPFPARMAPELALHALEATPPTAVVLDPMCGSGTVLQCARDRGQRAIGYDLDPLAVLISKVSCANADKLHTERAARKTVQHAKQLAEGTTPWIDSDRKTSEFVDFWFHAEQQDQLRRLSSILSKKAGKTSDILRVALSRTIVTKDQGASLARDVSHSRPHRVPETNSFDVYEQFLRAVSRITPLLQRPPADHTVSVLRRDARRLPPSLANSVDLIVTSPPYLNAIDYMRGHRMALVWLGYQLHELSTVRSTAIGAERYPDDGPLAARSIQPRVEGLSPRQQGMLDRYALDSTSFMRELSRVLKPSGEAVLVVGDSTLNGILVQNSKIVQTAAEFNGLTLVSKMDRLLPTTSRYLPPPNSTAGSLSKRMKHEAVMRFRMA